MKKTLSIAIDGPSAAGKSTLAKKVAKYLNFTYIDTGAMYRCVAYFCTQNNIDLNNEKEIENNLEKIDIVLDNGIVYLNEENVTDKIRTNEMSMGASKVSQYVCVRLYMVKLQQKMALTQSVVMDGRDIGTFVLPNADVKIFLEANVEERANRRLLDNKERGIKADYNEILGDLIQRDYNDSHRAFAPLKKADDAILVNTSHLDREQTFDKVLEIIQTKFDTLQNK